HRPRHSHPHQASANPTTSQFPRPHPPPQLPPFPPPELPGRSPPATKVFRRHPTPPHSIAGLVMIGRPATPRPLPNWLGLADPTPVVSRGWRQFPGGDRKPCARI